MKIRAALATRLATLYELGGEAADAGRNLPMEGLRGFAVTLVFFVHYHALFSPWLDRASPGFAFSTFLWSIGHSGVDLFFVLSGYLIYGAVIRRQRSYRSFIGRRVERIYPTFLCVLAIYLVLSMLFPAENKIPPGASAAIPYILANVLLLPGLFDIPPIITVAWSLSYEFFYYLLIPVLVGALRMRRWRPAHRVLFFLAVAAAYTAWCAYALDPRIRLIMFVSGILVYEAQASGLASGRAWPRLDAVTILMVVATFPLIYALIERPGLLSFLPGVATYGEIDRIVVLFATFLVFTLACFSGRSRLSRVFSWTPIRWLGNMSYSYYLFHGLALKGIALVMLRAVPPSGHQAAAYWLLMPVFFVGTLVASTLLFVLVERRFSLKPRPVAVRPGPAGSRHPAATGAEPGPRTTRP